MKHDDFTEPKEGEAMPCLPSGTAAQEYVRLLRLLPTSWCRYQPWLGGHVSFPRKGCLLCFHLKERLAHFEITRIFIIN